MMLWKKLRLNYTIIITKSRALLWQWLLGLDPTLYFLYWAVKGERTAALTSRTCPWVSSAELLGIPGPSPLTSVSSKNTAQQTTTCQRMTMQMYGSATEFLKDQLIMSSVDKCVYLRIHRSGTALFRACNVWLPLVSVFFASLSPVNEVSVGPPGVLSSAIPSAGPSAAQSPDPMPSAHSAPAPGTHWEYTHKYT